MIKVKKLHPDATFEKAHEDDVGYDLTCVGIEHVIGSHYRLALGVAVEPPPGYWFMIAPRSSFPKKGWFMCNSVGIVDPGYRGEWLMNIAPFEHELELSKLALSWEMEKLFIGKKVAQAILMPSTELLLGYYPIQKALYPKFVVSLSETDRGEGGFGSTG